MKIRIYSDVYNISGRIKEIDRDYQIVFDTDKNVYEVHNISQIGSTFCLTIPYNQLDYRALDLVWRTLSKNIDTIIARIDNDNKLSESENKARTFNQLVDILDGR